MSGQATWLFGMGKVAAAQRNVRSAHCELGLKECRSDRVDERQRCQ